MPFGLVLALATDATVTAPPPVVFVDSGQTAVLAAGERGGGRAAGGVLIQAELPVVEDSGLGLAVRQPERDLDLAVAGVDL